MFRSLSSEKPGVFLIHGILATGFKGHRRTRRCCQGQPKFRLDGTVFLEGSLTA